MTRTIGLGRRMGQALTAPAVLLFWPGTLWACSERTGSWWDWERCYCGWRVLVLPLVALVVLGAFCYPYLFLTRYLQQRKPPLWPREAFWRATAWYLFLMFGVTAVLFAGVSDEWRQSQWRLLPASWAWLDRNWPWLVILAVGAALALTLAYFTRRKPAPVPAAVR
jgi:hypothetical protein